MVLFQWVPKLILEEFLLSEQNPPFLSHHIGMAKPLRAREPLPGARAVFWLKLQV